MNSKNVQIFTDSLVDLYIEQSLSLIKALEIMAYEKRTEIQKASDYIKKELMRGNCFSNALSSCPFITFDQIYISFVSFSEFTGKLSETLLFLKKRTDRKAANKSKLIEASLYPAFIVLLAIATCFYLSVYTKSISSGVIQNKDFFQNTNVFFPVFILLTLCFLIYRFISNSLGENKLYEAFLAIDFLIKSGVRISNAVGAGIIITGPGTKYGNLFQKAKERLEFGMDVYNAFDSFKLNSELKNAFYYAHMAGNKADVFAKIAVSMGASDEKKRHRCLSLVEPMFIGITGMFLMLILVSYMMPLMANTNWIN